AGAICLVDFPDLLCTDRTGERNPVVAWDGEADGLLSASWYMDEDESVGGVAASAVLDGPPATRMQSLQDSVRQDLAGPVGTAFQAHQQDVLRPCRRAAGDRVRRADVGDVPDDKIRETADHKNQGRSHAGHGVPDCPG